jgi:hypothetical protein
MSFDQSVTLVKQLTYGNIRIFGVYIQDRQYALKAISSPIPLSTILSTTYSFIIATKFGEAQW